MRKYYIDNLRLVCILVLFPFHTLIAYNGLDIANPVFVESNDFASVFISVFGIWFMPLLFVFAGMSAVYSLQKRTAREFLAERCTKILIPMIAGMLTVVPAMHALGVLYYDPSSSFVDAFASFFTGSGFTYMHLWFLLFLFIVSVFALPIILRFMKTDNFKHPKPFGIWLLILFGFVLWFSSFLLRVTPDKSLLMYFLLFLAGATIMYAEWVQDVLEKYRWPLFASFVVLVILALAASSRGGLFGGGEWTSDLLNKMAMWTGILAVTGMGKRYLEFTNDRLKYLYAASFPIYIFHFPWIILIQFFLVPAASSEVLQIVVTILLAVPLTIGTYELLRRWSVTRFLFGMSKARPKKEASAENEKR